MQLTKIVATVGPNILHEEGIERLIKSGVSVFRFNFKHNVVEWHNDGIKLVNTIADRMNVPVATLIDLQGPSIRVNMPSEQLVLASGEKIYFGQKVFNKELKGLSVTHPQIIESLEDGQEIVADDGNIRFTFRKEGSETYLVSETNGILLNKKAINIPGSTFPFPTLVDRDFEGLKLVSKQEVDYIALSFVRSKKDVTVLRKEMAKFSIDADVISKIETVVAIKNLDEIIDSSDGIMVARGDLGVEMPYEEVPYYQKKIIEKCMRSAKPVITATQMLNSMTENPLATRAEVSDVANAVYDHTDAVMLSGETAYGKHPYKAVETMRKIATFNEKKLRYDLRKRYTFDTEDNEAKICEMAYNLFINFVRKSKNSFGGFLAFTKTGRTVRLISRYRPRPDAPIFAFTHSERERDKLALNFGVFPQVFEEIVENAVVEKDQIRRAIEKLVQDKRVKKGQQLIVVHGDQWDVEGGTSTVKLVKV